MASATLDRLMVGHGIDATIVNEDGSIGWTYPARATDGSVLANGNVLLALYPNERFPGGGMVEVTRDRELAADRVHPPASGGRVQ